MAAEYEVNIKLNTKEIKDELASIDKVIKDIGKGGRGGARGGSGASAGVAKQLSLFTADSIFGRGKITGTALKNVKLSWLSAFDEIQDVANTIGGRRSASLLNVKTSWGKAFTGLADNAKVLKLGGLNTQTSWGKALTGLQDNAKVLKLGGLNTQTSWTKALTGLQDNAKVIDIQNLNVRTSWGKALEQLGETAEIIAKNTAAARAQFLAGAPISGLAPGQTAGPARAPMQGAAFPIGGTAGIPGSPEFIRALEIGRLRSSPIGGAVNIAGSPAARRARRQQLEQIGLGAGFPLLFGGGAGSVIGGGLGGLTGSFGAQIAFSAAGQQLDNFFNQVRESANAVASALDGTSASFDALETVGIAVNAATIEYVRSLEESGQAVAAYMQVQETLAEVLGKKGVDSLLALQDANKDLNTELGKLQAVLMTELAPAFIAITKLGSGAADVLAKAVPILNFLFNPFRGNPIKEAEAAAALKGQQKIDAGVRERSAQIAANNEIEGINNATNAIERQTEALKLGTDLTDKKVVAAKKFNIIEHSSAEIAILNREITAATMEPLKQQQLQAKKLNLEARQAFELAQLDLNVQGAIQRSLERQNKQTATLANKEERQLEAAVKLETRFARQVKLLEAGSNFEKEKLRIEFELEDQLNSIAQLDNQSLAVQSELNAKKAAQLKLTEAQRKEEQRIAELRVRNLQEQGVPFSMEFAGLFGAYQSGGMGNFDLSTGIADLVRTEVALQAVLDKYPQIEQASLAMAETVTFGFRDIVDGAKSAEQVFADFLRSIADILMRTAAQMIAQYVAIGIARQFAGLGTYTPKFDGSSLFSSTPTSIQGVNPLQYGFPGLANGGTATAGRPYIVGERGPELFVPSQTGTVVPNHAMGGANVTVNVDASGTQAQGNQPNAKLLGQAIGAAVQAELIKQKRPGGLLAT